MCSNEQGRPNASLANLRKPMPLEEKLRLIRRNIGIKIVKHQTCCGHPGEPGC
jgi:hypothetical protein